MSDAMKIIRDDKMYGLAMIPLFVDYGIRRCNVDGCTDRPSTIILWLAPDIPRAGFCEEHYGQANMESGAKFDLTFDDFDAFTRQSEPAEIEDDTRRQEAA